MVLGQAAGVYVIERVKSESASKSESEGKR